MQQPAHDNQDPRADGQAHTQLTAGGTPVAGEFHVGDIIGGSYRVQKWIGAGGMGNVYRVQHTMMQSEYALKTLSADKVTEVAWRRFQNEAQAIARMSHPNVVGIYNLDLHEGRLPYYVMDLLQGDTMLDYLRHHGPMEVNQALDLFIEICSGLGYAHKKGIVHRDVKPPNIVLLDNPDPSCHLKIVDFGIAKLSGVKDPKNQYLTNVGEVCGSPFYMSPEQTQGQRIDARSDIYSLGCTLYEMLTGAPPFRGRSAMDTMIMHQTAPPPTLKAGANGKEFPDMLERVVATLLAKAPMDRYQTMERVMQDLSAIKGGQQAAINPYASQAQTRTRLLGEKDLDEQRESMVGEPAANPSKAKVITTTALLAVLILAGVGGVIWWWQGQSKSAVKANNGPAVATAVKASAPGPQSKAAGYEDGSFSVSDMSIGDKFIDKVTGAGELGLIASGPAPTQSLKDTEPYVKIVKIRGKAYKLFTFPTDFCLGFLGFPKEMKPVEAKGKVTLAADKKIFLEPNPVLIKYPQYLKRFRANDLDAIVMNGTNGSDALLEAIATLPGLRTVKLSGCANITQRGLNAIDKIPEVSYLVFDGAGPPAEKLAKLKCLPQLETLSLCSKSDISVVLDAVKNSRSLNSLFLNKAKVSTEDINTIAQIANLENLTLDQNVLSVEELKVLATCKSLKNLSIQDTRLDSARVAVLRKMHLTALQLFDSDLSSLGIYYVQHNLPDTKLVVEHDGSMSAPLPPVE